MSKKKIIILILVLGVLVFLLIPGSDPGDEFVMTRPNTSVSEAKIKRVVMVLDNSGSMRGYVDFASLGAGGANANSNMIGSLGRALDNIYKNYKINPIVSCGSTSYNRNDFIPALSNATVFNGATTELGPMIDQAVKQVDDTSVVLLVSDMVLSFGPKKIQESGDVYYNKHNLAQLGATIHKACTNLKKNYGMVLLQYLSDFNGKFYWNYTENRVPNAFANKLMQERPYYILAIGTVGNLRDLFSKHCLDRTNHVIATFGLGGAVKAKFIVKPANPAWLVGNGGKKPGKLGSIWTKSNLNRKQDTFTFSFDPIDVPDYITLNDEGKLDIVFDNKSIEDVKWVSDGELLVKAKPFSLLPKRGQAFIRLTSHALEWVDGANVDDDTRGDIKGKTWGIKTVVDNINKAFETDTSAKEISKLEFEWMKK